MKVKGSTATNPLQYSAQNEAMIERFYNEVAYEKKTTFFGDLSIAEWC